MNILYFIFSTLLAQGIFVSLSYGQLIFQNIDILKFSPLLLIIGGIQTLIIMKAVRIGKKVGLSILTIQLLMVFIGYFLVFLLNNLVLKHTRPSISDFIGFFNMLIGIYIGEKYKLKI